MNTKIHGSFFFSLFFCVLFTACSDKAVQDDLTLTFNGRDIRITPYFEEFPYSQFSVSKDGSKLFFFKTGNENKLQWLDMATQKDIREAQDVVDLNFAVRNCWSPRYNVKDNCVYWIGDEKNDEIINIYRTPLGSNHVEKLTDVPYIYAWNFNPEGTKIAYVARLGQNENRMDELRVLDLATLDDALICRDNPDFRFTWGSVCWQTDDKGMVLLALKDMDRTYTNIAYVDMETKSLRVLTDANKEASLYGCSVLDEWLSEDECLFLSDQNGYANLYRYRTSDKSVEQVTDYKMNIDEACYITVDGKKYLLALQSNPIETKMILLNPMTKEVIWQERSDLNLRVGTSLGDKVKLIATATNEMFQLFEGTVNMEGIYLQKVLDVPQDIKSKLVHAEVERLEIPTFDIDPATSTQRKLHAYLYKPLDPLPKDKQIVMIESFYGGENRYNTEYQIFNQAGIYVLSPSPRGSAGFGRDFAAMNDGDLGGNEILDIIYSAQYISKLLDIPAERIGVFGMSHGGYATMRLMTFPGEINGHQANFPFGFGVETAGFCDILLQHHTSNIPDWTSLEAGDPVKDSLKLVDRSPITHAEKITGPLLLIHGDHDNRVNVEGSRLMAKKLEELNKPYVYVEFPGLGHGIKGTDNNRKFYAETFDFMEKMVLK